MDPGVIARNLAEVRAEIGPDVEVLAAVKYLDAADLPALAEGGVTLLGENRAQELVTKAEACAGGPHSFTWDFIGQLQSRKVRQIAPHVRLIHSVASESALKELAKHARPGLEVLIEVNVAGEGSKAGIAPEALPAYLEASPVKVAGLMTMPPHTEDPERNRRHFAALRELAARHGLERLSMGTSQDYRVAVEEGATIVRLGTRLWRQAS